MVADQVLLAAKANPDGGHLKMAASLLRDSLEDDHHLHHHHHHERASSVTSDQYSSLNLSSVGSSAHHSPVGEPASGNHHHHHNNHHRPSGLSELVIALDTRATAGGPLAVGSLTSSSGLSDYHGSEPCSPLESVDSPLSPAEDLLLLGEHPSLKFAEPAAPTPAERTQQRPNSTISASPHNNNNNNNSLHPDANQPAKGQPHQKTRSYSHSHALGPPPAPPAAKGSAASTPAGKSPAAGRENQAPRPAAAERPRRLSRIENRQSLHDLGYGRIESYFKLQRLGKGTYGTVYMGRSKLSNDLVALKEILKEHDEGAPCTAIREVSLLRLLRHTNIVTLHDICHTPKMLTLVFEYVGPDLYMYMKENNHLLSIHNVRLLLYQLLRGLSFCHSRQVLHRDLKPQNLLINARGELKICDFGLARAKSFPTKSYSHEVVTLWYRPPDVLLGNTDYDHSIDMWGVGCIFYEMASGRTFFPGSSVRQQLYLIFSSLGAPSQANWPEVLTNPEYLSYSFPSFRPEKLAHRVPRLEPAGVQLLQSFLRFKPSERLSAEEARRDPFFACLPERVHHLSERESVLDVPGVSISLNPGQKLGHSNGNHHHHHHHHHHFNH